MYQTSMVRALNPVSLFSTGRAAVAQPTAPAQRRSENPSRHSSRSTRPHPTKRSSEALDNPSSTTWLLISGGVAAAVGVGIALFAKRAHAAPGGGGGVEPGGEEPGGGGGGGGGSGTVHHLCNYVDCDIALAGLSPPVESAPWSWPHMDRWPNSRQIAVQLQVLGYSPFNPNASDFSMVRQKSMNAASGFQTDYNKVRANWQALGLSPAPTAPNLSTDGLMGANTMKAFYDASLWSATQSWPDLVDQAESM